MRTYVARQLVQLVVVIVGISLLVFALLHVIGDPVLALLPLNAGKEEYERHRKILGLDKPLWVQYWDFASHAVRGDFDVQLANSAPGAFGDLTLQLAGQFPSARRGDDLLNHLKSLGV